MSDIPCPVELVGTAPVSAVRVRDSFDPFRRPKCVQASRCLVFFLLPPNDNALCRWCEPLVRALAGTVMYVLMLLLFLALWSLPALLAAVLAQAKVP